VLAVTGTFNLWFRGVRLGDFGRSEWLESPFGQAVVWKLGSFLAVVMLSAIHDFFVGPQAARLLTADPQSADALRLRRYASMLGRTNVLLALVLVALAVVMVRGVPW
jgi:copper resistance protein D